MAPAGRRRRRLGPHVRATRQQEVHQVRLGVAPSGKEEAPELHTSPPTGKGQFQREDTGGY